MSEESKALARRYLEVFAEGNFDVIPEILAPDYVEHVPASEREVRGHDGVRRDLEPYVNAFSDAQVAVDDQVAEADRVATRVTIRATHVEELRGIPPTGERIEVTGTVFHRVAGGRLVEGWWNWDTLGLLQQPGAIPAEQTAYPAMQRRVIVEQMRSRAVGRPKRAERAQAEATLIDGLRAGLRGEVIDRAHPAYDEARAVWNGLIDRRPAAIARCADAADVIAAVRVAREHRPPVSVRGGGHQVAGSAVCDDGLVIDLSAMREVAVDPVARVARVAGGARWADVDRATQAFGLATPGGEVSATGVAGLTLGGGIGATMRAYGLSCDNVRSAEIVTADGELRRASRDEHPDLFWALRGGGRGLGVVTSLEFQLHSLGPEVASALLLYPYDDAESVLREWRDHAPQAPDEVTPEIGLWSIPPLPELPEQLHGEPVVFVAGLHAGPLEEAAPALAPLRQLGDPLVDLSATGPYVEAQSALDDLFPSGGRYYWKSHFLDELSDAAIATMLEHAAIRPNPDSVIYIRTLGGAITRAGVDETAYAHRSAAFNLSVDAIWSEGEDDEAAIAWARSTWDALRPHATGGIYLNFAGLGEDGARRAALGSNEERLERIRQAYDSEGLFEAAARQP